MVDAPSLLRRYGALALLSEHLQWEALGLHAPRYQPVRNSSRAKTLIILDGIPGAGKSTTCRWLVPALGAAYFSMARSAEGHGVSSQERLDHQLAHQRLHPVDVAFLDTLAACPARYLILEKFPRSSVEAAALLARARELCWNLEVLHLDLPGDCVELSTSRQIARGPRRGQVPEVEYARHRALAHTARTSSSRRLLAQHGVPVHRFDMTRPAVEVRADIRCALQIDPAALLWHQPTLEVLEAVAGTLGIEAYLAGGSFYRPFWNDRFGPMQLPTDADVAVSHEWEVAPLLDALTRVAPRERWSVLCPSSRLAAQLGIEADGVVAAKALSAFMHRAGLVRRYRGEVELVMPPEAEGALWNGVVKLNPALLERLSVDQRSTWLARHGGRLPGVLARYPGLTVDAATAQLLEMPRVASSTVGAGFTALKAHVLAQPLSRARPRARRRLSAAEHDIASNIVAFHRESGRQSAPPPRPRKPLRPLEPASLVSIARDADDDTFGAWLLDQQRHEPLGGHDPDVRSVMTLELSPSGKPLHRELSAMHQGWTLDRHLLESALQLETDALVAAAQAPELRLCMRVAMLYHDIGKVFGERPTRHPRMSARMFAKHRPMSFPEHLIPITQWMIRSHDVFGVFTRALTDKVGRGAGDYEVDLAEPSSYYGALDAQAARAKLEGSSRPFAEALAIAKALWRADVGAIASLRWLLPVADLVEQLLLLPVVSGYVGVERRAI